MQENNLKLNQVIKLFLQTTTCLEKNNHQLPQIIRNKGLFIPVLSLNASMCVLFNHCSILVLSFNLMHCIRLFRSLHCSVLLLIACSLHIQAQSDQQVALKYLAFTNAYQGDSLQRLLADDFQFKRSFVAYSNDKSSFINAYIPFSRQVSGTFTVLGIQNRSPLQYLVRDESDYIRYLNLEFPTWILTITTKNQQVKLVLLDTTDSSARYLREIPAKDDAFRLWQEVHHPDETSETLYNTDGLLVKRLKEYAEQHKE